VELAVDADDRRQAAGTNAGHDFQAEHAISAGLAGVDLQFPLDRFEDRRGAFHVAGRTATDLDVERALGLEPELVVEGRHTIDFAGR